MCLFQIRTIPNPPVNPAGADGTNAKIPDMNPEESQPQATGSFFQRIINTKNFNTFFVLILILIPLTFNIVKKKSQEPPPTTSSKSKMWEIRFAYDTEKQVLTVKNVTLKDGRATASNLGLSPTNSKF